MVSLTLGPNTPVDFEEIINNGPFPIRFPKKGLPQDEEWCEVLVNNEWRRVRFHDYHEVYKVPGLYETIFYRTLMCNSPNRISSMLGEVIGEAAGVCAEDLRVLDLGAGNGMSGEALQKLGVRKIVGVDLLPEAKTAALRDRPWVYDHYFATDLTNLKPEEDKFLSEYKFNGLCTVAALGFGDIPPAAFYKAFNYIANGGFVAFNIRDIFLKKGSTSGFAKLIDRMVEAEVIELELLKRYRHRLNTQGLPLYYVGIVARKNQDIPAAMI